VQAINKELHKHPTSTGVRYRLQWQPLGEDEGARIGVPLGASSETSELMLNPW